MYLKFRKTYNPQPLIYTDFCQKQVTKGTTTLLELRNSTDKFLEEPESNPMPDDWSNAFLFPVPNIPTSSNGVTQVPWIIRLMNIRLEKPTVPLPVSVVTKEQPIDNIFGPISELPAFAQNVGSQWQASARKSFIKDPIYSGVFLTIIAVDSNNTGFYFFLLDEYTQWPSIDLEELQHEEPISGGGFAPRDNTMAVINIDEVAMRSLTWLSSEIDVVYIKDFSPTTGISNFHAKKQLGSLLLSLTNYNSLLSLAQTSLNDDYHDILVKLDGYKQTVDDDGFHIYKGDISLNGLDNSGVAFNVSSSLTVFGLQHLQLADADSVIQLPEKLRKANELEDYTSAIEVIETYYHQLRRVGLPPPGVEIRRDATPDQTVTRVRSQYYGWPGQGRKSIAFNSGVPQAPYVESNPDFLPNNPCPDIHLIPRTFRQKFNEPFCIPRVLNAEEIGQNHYKIITDTQYLHNNGIYSDFGHSLYGLCALRHGGLNGAPVPLLQNVFGIDHSIDFTSFVGDLASVVGQAYGDPAVFPSQAVLDDRFDGFLAKTDIYGDVDIFGLNRAWEKVSVADPNFTLVDVLNHYYGPTPPPDNNIAPSHFTKRFTIISQDFNFIDTGGNWVINSLSTTYTDLRDRIISFAVFYYNPIFNLSRAIRLGLNLKAEQTDMDISVWYNNFRAVDVDYVLDRFLNDIKTGYDNE